MPLFAIGVMMLLLLLIVIISLKQTTQTPGILSPQDPLDLFQNSQAVIMIYYQVSSAILYHLTPGRLLLGKD